VFAIASALTAAVIAFAASIIACSELPTPAPELATVGHLLRDETHSPSEHNTGATEGHRGIEGTVNKLPFASATGVIASIPHLS